MKIITTFLYLLSLGGFLTQVFIYPGFIQKLVGIHPVWFLLVYAICAAYSHKTPRWLYTLNRLVVLPISLILALFFSLLEAINYPNYVFYTYHIHHVNLGFIFLQGYLTFIISQGQRNIKKNYQKYFFLTSSVLIILFLIFSTGDKVYTTYLAREDGVWETAQFILFSVSGMAACIGSLILSKYSRRDRLIYFLFGLGLIFIAMEEISWGQRYFGIQTPERLKEVNLQQELNVHNLPFIFYNRDLVYVAVGLYGGFAWTLSKKISKLFTPQKYLSLCFLSVAFYYGLYSHLFGDYHAFSEFSELMLTFGLAGFTLDNLAYPKRGVS